MRHVVVGTAGHIDHGKSTLVRALTGTDPDRLPEEKRRGITIDLGFAHTEIEGITFSFVDVPGHEKFVHNMLAGATGIDLVLLVVAADESVMPQTREHLAICSLLGLSAGVVALTRIDLVDADLAGVAAEEVREFVARGFPAGWPLVRVSGVTGEGLEELRAALVECARRLPERASGPWPRLPVDRVFAARGFGTVVTGTLQGGPLRAGDTLVAVPGRASARVRGLQVHGQSVDEAGPHRRVAVNLQGLDRREIARGVVLVPPGLEVETLVFDACVAAVDDPPVGLEDGQRVRIHHGTAELMGRLRLPGGAAIAPGASGACQVRLEAPLAALPGDRFIVRRYSPIVTLGGGVIVDVDPPRWRRADSRWPRRVEELARAGAPERLALAAREAGDAGLAVSRRAVALAITPAEALRHARDLAAGGEFGLLANDLLVERACADRLLAAAKRELSRFHRERPLEAGLPVERLRADLAPAWPADAFRELLARGQAEGWLAVAAEGARLARHASAPEGQLAEVHARLLKLLDEAGLEALGEDDLLWQAGATERGRELLLFAQRAGQAVKIKGDLWISGTAWRAMVERLRAEAAAGRPTLDVPAFKELFGLTRKYAIPILERLDEDGVTQRVGNERRIRTPSR
ncbi:MAG: selenocysteine-specific translation elongation factor [Acidobacteria bacterium]|nr:selenocysteine-specific translation elongation factor [Acidobacteriota bacterium]